MLFFYSVPIEYDNGRAAAVRLREGFIKPSHSWFHTFTLFLRCSWSINWSHPWEPMLPLTGRLELLNVLRITELTANQSINYEFKLWASSRIGLEFFFIGHVFRLQHRKMVLYPILAYILFFPSQKTTPIHHLKAHLSQESSSSWRTLSKFHKWTSKIAFKARHSALPWLLYIIFLSSVPTPRPWGIVC